LNTNTFATLLLGCCLATPAGALDELPEILVTAELRDTDLQSSSASTSVLGELAIRQRAAQHLEELLNMAPNVNYASGTSRARYFQIRGIGDRSQFQEPLNPSVGLLLDGVDFSGIGSIGTLFDIEQVEVLRGPQGTLHGANALAGLINMRSNAPSEEFHHQLEATAGDYDSYGVGVISSGPLSDAVLYRVALQQYNSDGYTENDYLGKDDTNQRDELTSRLRLRWLADEHHSLDLGVTWIDVDNGYDAFSLDNTRHTLSDQPGTDRQQSLALSLQDHLEFRALQLQTALTYATTDTDYNYDEDWTYVGFHPDGYSSSDRYQRQRDSYSAELRLLSTEASRLLDGRTEWVLGLYYLSNDEDLGRDYTYAPRFDSDYKTETVALFLQLDTALTDSLTLITGVRAESRDTDYRDNNGVSFDKDKQLWGGKLALEYQWTDDTMAYLGASRGYRANGVNAGILSSIDSVDDPDIRESLNRVRDFDEETLLNYEIGIKTAALANTLQARIALFYMDRDDQQVRGSFLIPREDGATSFVDYTSNAASGENYGAEIEVDWLLTEGLQLWANLGVLDTQFNDYTNIFGEDLSGRDQAQAPRYQFSLGGRYSFVGGLYMSLELEGKDAFYFSDRHNLQSDDYTLLNGSIGYQGERWQLSLWGRNLGDEDYYVRGFGSFGNDPRKGYVTEPYYQFGEPRMIGVSGSYTF